MITRLPILLLALLSLAAPAAAVDDCPVGATKHAALTGLDHASMEAAVRASFVGLYHRAPTGIPGSGPDDVGFWISTFDHYGAYGDAICRAGWNAYAELRLSGAAIGDPALGDQPARFQPSSGPPVVVEPAPEPLPSRDASAGLDLIADRLGTIESRLTNLEARVADKQDVAAIREDVRSFRAAANDVLKVVAKYVAPVVAGVIGGMKLK